MVETKDDIIAAIEAHMLLDGGSCRDWYVGTSQNTMKEIFKKHNIKKNKEWWICRQIDSTQVVKEVVTYFIDLLGTDGGIHITEPDAGTMVYAYKKSQKTTP